MRGSIPRRCPYFMDITNEKEHRQWIEEMRQRRILQQWIPSKSVLEDFDLINCGVHQGYVWAVRHNGMGFRCGYARVPNCHPWFGKSDGDNYLSVDVHGGITYGTLCTDGWWVGFDCAHHGDAPDLALPIEEGRRLPSFGGTTRTQIYAEGECYKLCEQAHQAWKETH